MPNSLKTPLANVLVKPAGPDCNLDCSYCFYKGKSALYPGRPQHRMAEETLEELVRQVMRAGGRQLSFVWQGGEPTLAGLDFFRSAVALQQQYGRGQVVGNGFQTNGLLLDREWARFFRRYNFLVGLSIDGPQDLHDRHRTNHVGHGSHQRAWRAVRILRRHSVALNVLVVLTRANVLHPRELYEYFVTRGISHLQFIPCAESESTGHAVTDYSVTPEQYGAFLCELFDLWAASEQLVSIRLFVELLNYLFYGATPSCQFSRSCGNYLVVEHNGDVYPCDFFVEPAWRLGNLLERPLWELIRSELFLAFRSRKIQLPPECCSCSFVRLCYGGCPRYRVVEGQLGAPSYFCSAYKRLFIHLTSKGLNNSVI